MHARCWQVFQGLLPQYVYEDIRTFLLTLEGLSFSGSIERSDVGLLKSIKKSDRRSGLSLLSVQIVNLEMQESHVTEIRVGPETRNVRTLPMSSEFATRVCL